MITSNAYPSSGINRFPHAECAFPLWASVLITAGRRSREKRTNAFSFTLRTLFSARKAIGTILITLHCYSGQAQSIEDDITKYFATIRAGQASPPPSSLYDSIRTDEVLNNLKRYAKDSLPYIRIRACELTSFLCNQSHVPSIRQKGVDILFSAYAAGDIKRTGVILQILRSFQSTDFSDTAKHYVRLGIKSEGPYLGEWMRLAAFLNLKDVLPNIRPYAQPGNRQNIRWDALLSLARLGDQSSVTEILMRVKKLKVNDEFVYGIIPELIFTRQPEPIGYAIEILQDDATHCLSASPDNEVPIPCGYRIMEQLAPVIDGFPLKSHNSGDLITEDYAQALRVARTWLKQNYPYTIRQDTY